MADREAEEKWREGGVAAKLSGIPHLVVAGWKEGEGEEGDSFQPFAPLFGKRLKKKSTCDGLKGGKKDKECKSEHPASQGLRGGGTDSLILSSHMG